MTPFMYSQSRELLAVHLAAERATPDPPPEIACYASAMRLLCVFSLSLWMPPFFSPSCKVSCKVSCLPFTPKPLLISWKSLYVYAACGAGEI